MSYLKHVMAAAIIAAGSVVPLQAQAAHHTKNVPHKTSSHHKKKQTTHASTRTYSYGALQRMHNRALLLAKTQEYKRHTVPVIEGDAHSKAALRAQNRTLIEQHPEWFVPYRSHTLHLQDGTSLANDPHLQEVIEQVISRLQQQLGKPYVWGGASPEEGFDCSGLVFFAYNRLLAAKLPRTANEMYHYARARTVADNDLQRGDLLFFHIHTREKADHVGVYLGDGRFIESPRTGERIRISYLADDFWQQHYLGSKRILTTNTVL